MRDYLSSVGFVERVQDREATVFQKEGCDCEILMHKWRGALQKGTGLTLSDKRKAAKARETSEMDIDTAGWSIVMRGESAVCNGITNVLEAEFAGITPVKTKEGSTVYSLGHAVRHEIQLPVMVWKGWEEGASSQPSM